MITTHDNIDQAIEEKINEAKQLQEKHGNANGVACVLKAVISKAEVFIGTRVVRKGSEIGDLVPYDNGSARPITGELVWVHGAGFPF